MDYLLNAQKCILENTHNGYYAKAYKDEEYKYWDALYHWMVANKPKLESCLDVGCAYGTWLAIVKQMSPNCKLHGIDFVSGFMQCKMIDALNLNFKVCNIQTDEIPFTNKFDMVLLTEVLEHFNYLCIPTLTKIVNQIADNGYLLLSTPNSTYWEQINYDHYSDLPLTNDEYLDGHVYQFSIDEIIEIANILKIKPIMLGTNSFGHINGVFQKGGILE
jgi:2-polyprenyl-3-methyl-5-hydroxy-6-metoxy-1,4-benzoquinol methylase